MRGRKGEYKKELAELMKKGFQRVKVDGQFYEIADAPALDKKYKHDIDVVVDRIVVRADVSARLADSLETSLKLADGLAVAEFADKPPPPEDTAAGGSANKSLNETHERVLFRKIRLPGLRLHYSGNRTAALLLQQSGRRVPDLRRSWRL